MSDNTILSTDLKSRLDQGDALTLLDVRAKWEFDTCHIPGSIHLPLTELTERLSEIPMDKPIVTICHHGVRSLQALRILKEHGIKDARSLMGGIHSWAEQVDPSMEQY